MRGRTSLTLLTALTLTLFVLSAKGAVPPGINVTVNYSVAIFPTIPSSTVPVQYLCFYPVGATLAYFSSPPSTCYVNLAPGTSPTGFVPGNYSLTVSPTLTVGNATYSFVGFTGSPWPAIQAACAQGFPNCGYQPNGVVVFITPSTTALLIIASYSNVCQSAGCPGPLSPPWYANPWVMGGILGTVAVVGIVVLRRR